VIGRFAMIGMGSVVTKSVPDFYLVIGHPAISIGCVCRCGQPLLRFKDSAIGESKKEQCGACGLSYVVSNGMVKELNHD
jgi:serine acetyltransferase